MYPRKDTKTSRFGFWRDGEWLVSPQFNLACSFRRGLAFVVSDEGEKFFLTKSGDLRSLTEILHGRRLRNENEFYGFDPWSDYQVVHLDTDGDEEWGLITNQMSYRSLPGDTFSTVKSVSAYGNFLICSDQSSPVHGACYGIFDIAEWRLIEPMRFAAIRAGEHSAWVVGKRLENESGFTYAFYDLHSHRLASGWYYDALPFSEGLGALTVDGVSWAFVDVRLRQVFDQTFDRVEPFSSGLAAVFFDDDAGYIDITGRIKLIMPYEGLGPFNRYGWALANRDESDWDIDIIDKTGRAHFSHAATAVFMDGDFPYYDISTSGADPMTIFLDTRLNTICVAKTA